MADEFLAWVELDRLVRGQNFELAIHDFIEDVLIGHAQLDLQVNQRVLGLNDGHGGAVQLDFDEVIRTTLVIYVAHFALLRQCRLVAVAKPGSAPMDMPVIPGQCTSVNKVYAYKVDVSINYTNLMNKIEPPDSSKPSWSQQRRLRFIDFRIQWDGVLNRGDLRSAFNISTPQASNDISKYQELWGERLRYDKSSKSYVSASTYKPAYATTNAQQYLAQLLALGLGIVEPQESMLGFKPPVGVVPLPTRAADDGVLRCLVHAIRDRQMVEVEYQSITRNEQRRRRISPHAFAHDGYRWHVRAYCHLRNDFRDFVIGRILTTGSVAPTEVWPDHDKSWHQELELVLVPHPELEANPRSGVETDFKMVDGRTTLRCKQAMLFYVLRSLNLDVSGAPMPGVRQVVLANLAELTPFLPTIGQH